MKTAYLFIGLLSGTFSSAQDITSKLTIAVRKLESDAQFRHAILSLYVVDSKTGKPVFDKNGQAGLAPASCQKVVTSAAAFDILGKGYRYKTELGYGGKIVAGTLYGDIQVTGYGDPTLGSWRFPGTNEATVMDTFIAAIQRNNIKSFRSLTINNSKWGTQTLPDGWVWQDIGNYYGAGISSFNWHENQYDLILQPGMRVGDSIKIITSHPNPLIKWVNELKTAGKGSGDKAYIYYPPYSFMAFVRGTIPLGEDSFKISGATTNGVGSFSNSFLKRMGQGGLDALNFKSTYSDLLQGYHNDYTTDTIFYTYLSPTLDSINYWFLKKSINLYGEAFVKTIAYEKTGFGSTDTGVAFIKDFWSKQGIEKSALNIIDGSGLSPANRVTTYALVAVMQYARKQTWFPSFYNALPEMNGLTMKDGYISGVRSYTGYVKNKTGAEYTFSFIVNNFDGSAATVREKIWKVLDILK